MSLCQLGPVLGSNGGFGYEISQMEHLSEVVCQEFGHNLADTGAGGGGG